MQELRIEFLTKGLTHVVYDCVVVDEDDNIVGRLISRGFSLKAEARDALVYSVEVPARYVRVVNER